jgi:hypothetical protein
MNARCGSLETARRRADSSHPILDPSRLLSAPIAGRRLDGALSRPLQTSPTPTSSMISSSAGCGNLAPMRQPTSHAFRIMSRHPCGTSVATREGSPTSNPQRMVAHTSLCRNALGAWWHTRHCADTSWSCHVSGRDVHKAMLPMDVRKAAPKPMLIVSVCHARLHQVTLADIAEDPAQRPNPCLEAPFEVCLDESRRRAALCCPDVHDVPPYLGRQGGHHGRQRRVLVSQK